MTYRVRDDKWILPKHTSDWENVLRVAELIKSEKYKILTTQKVVGIF